jgi:hypothetical protein
MTKGQTLGKQIVEGWTDSWIKQRPCNANNFLNVALLIFFINYPKGNLILQAEPFN